MEQFRIEGARIATIPDLYIQLNAQLMEDAGWRMGASLDALNDVLYRFHKGTAEAPAAELIWADHAQSRSTLGFEATREWLEQKLTRPDAFNVEGIQRQLDNLLAGAGPTYFDLVLEVFADHPGVRLTLS